MTSTPASFAKKSAWSETNFREPGHVCRVLDLPARSLLERAHNQDVCVRCHVSHKIGELVSVRRRIVQAHVVREEHDDEIGSALVEERERTAVRWPAEHVEKLLLVTEVVHDRATFPSGGRSIRFDSGDRSHARPHAVESTNVDALVHRAVYTDTVKTGVGFAARARNRAPLPPVDAVLPITRLIGIKRHEIERAD